MTSSCKDRLIFRQASADDAEALLDLYEFLTPGDVQCPLPRARDNIAQITRLTGSAVLIGVHEGAPVTTCTLIVIPNLTRGGRPYALIENVVTHPDHRGQGLGTAMLEVACDRAWAADCYKVMLSTGSADRATLSFYESAGFEQSRTGFQKRRLPIRPDGPI